MTAEAYISMAAKFRRSKLAEGRSRPMTLGQLAEGVVGMLIDSGMSMRSVSQKICISPDKVAKIRLRCIKSGLLAALCLCASVVQSPAAWFSWKKPAPVTNAPIYSPVPVEAASVPAPTNSNASAASTAPVTNRTVSVSLAWNASADHSRITNYAVLVGTNSGKYFGSANAGTNLSLTLTNLLPLTRYYFAATATDRAGVTSTTTPEIFWPLPYTNYVAFWVNERTSLTATGRTIWRTNLVLPPGVMLFYAAQFEQTNNQVPTLVFTNGVALIANTNQP